MNACAWFGVGVRLMGLYWVVSGILTLTGAAAPSQGYSAMDYLSSGVPSVVMGLFLMRLTSEIVSFSYSRDPEDSDSV